MSMSEVSDEITQGEFDMLDISDIDKPEVEIHVPSLPEDCINLFDKSQVLFYSKNNKSYLAKRRGGGVKRLSAKIGILKISLNYVNLYNINNLII
jgi:hypothetical protein